MIAPANRVAMSRPRMVTTGLIAPRNACLTYTWRVDRPLARTVRMKSSFSTSTMDDLVSRAYEAMKMIDRHTHGSSMPMNHWPGLSKNGVYRGSGSRSVEYTKMYRKNGASTKICIEPPMSANDIEIL